MSGNARFAVFVIVSLVVFVLVLRLVLGRREPPVKQWTIGWVALIVIAAGMPFGRVGAQAGLAWWIYYTVPALTTLLLPPLAFRMTTGEVLRYLLLAVIMAPAIHVVFSFALGWHDYMPFLPVPSWWEAFG